MTEFFRGLLGRYSSSAALSPIDERDKRNLRKAPKYRSWCTGVSKKVSQTDTLLKAFLAIDATKDRKDKSTGAYLKLVTSLNELAATLAISLFKDYAPLTNGNCATSVEVHTALTDILELWGHLLEALSKIETVERDPSALYNAIICAQKRMEFNNAVADPVVDLAARYRQLLFSTQIAACSRLVSDLTNVAVVTMCLRITALSFFRIRPLADAIVACVAPEGVINSVKHIAPEYVEQFLASQKGVSKNRTSLVMSWPQFHESITAIKPDTLDSQLLEGSHEWLDLFARRDTLFVVFFKECILHIRSSITEPVIDWPSVPGYLPLLLALLSETTSKPQPPPPMSKPYPLLDLQLNLVEHTNGEVVSSLMKAVFAHTNAFDLQSVLNTMLLLEAWFLPVYQLKTPLPPSFDHKTFCGAMEGLLKTEHHHKILRSLQLIYAFAELFEGEARTALFSELLLDKYFYELFLHWDPGVRNAFQQTLIYKMVRPKRVFLYKYGYVDREIARLAAASNSPRGIIPSPRETSINITPSKPPAIPDSPSKPSLIRTVSRQQNGVGDAVTNPDPRCLLDVTYFVKLDTMLKQIEQQKSSTTTNVHFSKSMEVYADPAIIEYNNHLAKYQLWEQRDAEPPKLLPLSYLSCMQE